MRTNLAITRSSINLVAFLLGGLAFLWIFARIFGDGETDSSYMKVASPRARSMIVGTSRAGFGLRPSAFSPDMVNFACSIFASPYGETYHHAISKKLGRKEGGLFIVEVSPVALSFWREDEPQEQDGILGRLCIFSGRPNLNYVLRCYGQPLWSLSMPPTDREIPFRVHRDGWTEVESPRSLEERAERIKNSSSFYAGIFKAAKPSDYRIEWLRETCVKLSDKGQVILVRLPVGTEMFQMETAYWPEFDGVVERLALELGVPYLNLSDRSADELTSDGSHLDLEASERISREIAAHAKRLRTSS